ncbi:MAG: glutamate-5-semialdehyde dehydrogenase [Prevotella sp.]|nr:glutamate-5-semialdehyde dehydrogenase [Prevotella sp.]
MQMTETFQRVKSASKSLTAITEEQRRDVLMGVADAIVARQEELLEANRQDLARMDPQNPLYDRLQLTAPRLEAIAADMRHVAELPSPLGLVTDARTLPNGLRIHRVSVPFGVIGVVYEARPNVTFDVFALCFKSGNACVLKGGRDAEASNEAGVRLIKEELRRQGIDDNAVALLPATHEATAAMLSAVGYVDVCIPRGGRRLIDFVRDNARVPVIETGAGVVHVYFDRDGDLEKGRRIINNAKTRRVSVCNALDTLLVHKDRLSDLPALLAPMDGRVELFYNDESRYDVEFMDYKMNVVTVGSLDEAIAHIDRYGSGHSEAIITENEQAARRFQQQVDAACVYWNAPTSFTDGAQFGLGAEIGISTQKLGPRGPMGLREITTYKWIIEGEGQTRP